MHSLAYKKGYSIAVDCFFSSVYDIVFLVDSAGSIMASNASAKIFLEEINHPLNTSTLGALFPNLQLEFCRRVNNRAHVLFHFEIDFPFNETTRHSYRCWARPWMASDRGTRQYMLILQRQGRGQCDALQQFNCKHAVQEREYKRFAADLHDGIGQQLVALKFFLNGYSQKMGKRQQVQLLEKCHQLLSSILVDMRRICFNLRPQTLERAGLFHALQELKSNLLVSKSFEIQVEYPPNIPPLEQELEFALYRIAQEFIANSLKHANATALQIDFNWLQADNCLEVNFADNGIGLHKAVADPAGSYGLSNIRSRILAHQGQFHFHSAQPSGLQLKISIPL